MTTKDSVAHENLDKMTENLEKIEGLSKRLVAAMSHRRPVNPTLNAPDQEVFTKAATAYWQEAMP